MKRPSHNPSAGSAEPNWFEWQNGLLHLVEMLDEDTEVVAVAFQLHGIKGWDDVGVRFRNGTTRLLQMKHSRSGDTLTFGDMTAPGENGGPSLLRALARAWKDERASRGTVQCVLVTNRPAGPNWYEGRPPLGKFFERIKVRVTAAVAIGDVRWDGEDDRYPGAWQAFLFELSDLNPPEQIAFLKSLELETSAPDLKALEVRLYERLTTLTGLLPSSVRTLFNTLHAHLRKWTCQTRREAEWIDREALRGCLAGDDAEPPWLGHCEVETPEPFFPSRVPLVEALRSSLLSESAHKVDFLSAEPGAGKTSCTSKLARSGAVRWQEQCVSIRFYAYRPIRPGQPDVGSDIAGVRAEALWLGLLWQIRDHLRTTHSLSELCVPVWLDGMAWEVARAHVIRLADALGQRWGRPFIICIDGIDHAARAKRKNLPQFLETLPSPDSIPTNVRFFLAGQPSESFPEYPFFLRHPHAAVRVHPLGELTDEDLRLLWRAAKPRMAVAAEGAVLRLLVEKTRRRTLPAVYVVENIRESTTLDGATVILNARSLPHSVNHYYDTIWSAAMLTQGDGQRLAAAFALLRERPTGELIASAFSEVGKSALEWRDVLRALRPLVRETGQGFELVHNDLRVHLEARLAGDPAPRRDAASALANHYRKLTCNRLAAHRSLLNLLVIAEREGDFANDFTVDWVIEAGALGVADETIPYECSAAFRAAVSRREWLLLHEVACAALTFHRLHECVTKWSQDDDPLISREIPAFLPVEGEPRPLELWSFGDFSQLVAACRTLAAHGAPERAGIVLKQWVAGIPLDVLVGKVAALSVSAEQQGSARDTDDALFEQFGRLCAICNVTLPSTGAATNALERHLVAVESGWAAGLNERPDRRNALRLWCLRPPRYLAPWLAAVEAAAAGCRWGEVRALMKRISHCAEDFTSDARIRLGWHAARAKPANRDLWFQAFVLPDYGLPRGNATLALVRIVAQWIAYTDPLREPAQIADELLPLLDLRGMESKNPSTLRLLLRASAVIGRVLRYRDRGDFEGLEMAVPPAMLAPYLDALWCREPDWQNLPHEEVRTPGEIGHILAALAWDCGQPHRLLLRDLASSRFPDVMLNHDGRYVFDILWDWGEHSLLSHTVSAKAQEVIARLHEEDVSSRNRPIANLLHFAQRLGMPDLSTKLSRRLGTTRIGYSSHKEWVFEPLVRWFEYFRKRSPHVWRSEGMQLLALDRIASQQGADNSYGDDLHAEVGAAAMSIGADEFEGLFHFLVNRDAKSSLWDLAQVVKGGSKICVREQLSTSKESVLARAAISIAVGRWPRESPLGTVSGLLSTSSTVAVQPPWQRALRLAAEIQGVTPNVSNSKHEDSVREEPKNTSTAEQIMSMILQPGASPSMWLHDFTNLAEQANAEAHPKRDEIIATALGVLESGDALIRCIQFNSIDLMSRLCTSLTESERWRLMAAMTAVTGEIRSELHDADWSFMSSFSAVDLMCSARAGEAEQGFALTAFQQLISMHWKWHGIPPYSLPVHAFEAECTWLDAARRMLLALTRTDGCEPLYMVMCGLRFFADAFPDQIEAICREGLSAKHASDAILPLAQLWATRHPHALAPALADFKALEGVGTLETRLEAWTVGALFRAATNEPLRIFPLPPEEIVSTIHFPGDSQLFEAEAQLDGLMRHVSSGGMANDQLRRVGLVLGSMETAFRYLIRTLRQGGERLLDQIEPPRRMLTIDGNCLRPDKQLRALVGEAVLHQCSGKDWSPSRAARVRLALGCGMDPWIASATPNPWPDDATWPSSFDVENWIEAGASASADVARRIDALLGGEDLAPGKILLGAVLHIPTFRRDLEFRYWLSATKPTNDSSKKQCVFTPSGRSLAGWLACWSSEATQSPSRVSVQFVGALVAYPNSELEITPTDQWTREWQWQPNPENALSYRTPNGETAAWHERWLGPDSSFQLTCRQPLLSRWIARRDCIPKAFNELRQWTRNTESHSGMLSKPE